MAVPTDEEVVKLPPPRLIGKMSVEEALAKRASVREFSREPLSVSDISQLLWSAQGVTRSWGARTAPSAGALYPLEIYIVLPHGVFRYDVRHHSLIRHLSGNVMVALAQAALGQGCVRQAPSVLVIAAVYERTASKYGSRAERYVKIEVGHAAQNVLLAAVSLGLVSVPVGAFQDQRVKEVLNLPANQEPLYLLPVGYPAKNGKP
ncbi:MAG: SagB/ThcOx family dehydrogenase [Syntrophales bacterium]|nr:SagB/ThcOx family dehydrogenase [Syntrophales bacterium]